MSIYAIRTSGVMPLALSCHWQHHSRKLEKLRFQLPHNFRISIKTSHWHQSRWPGKRNIVNNTTAECHVPIEHFALSRLVKPLAFTVSVSGLSLAGAAIWQYENVRAQATSSRQWWNTVNSPKYGSFRQHVNGWWSSLSAGDKAFVPICAINVVVFLAWLLPGFQPVMYRYFTAGLTPSNALCWPMLLSVFSHYSIFHLAANMFVLRSFSDKAVNAMGKEQFIGVYLSAGVISSFTSLLFKAIIKSPSTSIGASGAVMCMLAYVCSKYPHSQLAVIFLPQYPFEASLGLKTLLGIDTVGCIMRWKFFDHAAHLGGSLFGIAWFHWGNKYIWKRREPLVSAWHKMRGPVQ